MAIKVLVADDSPTIRRRASATLADAGYEVSCVEDGRAAWREMDAGHVPDVLLCDVLMPELDGYELCQMVKADARFARVPVMLLRGTFEPWDQARAESVGADGFITKPFEPEALVTTLRELVAETASHGGGSPEAAQHETAEVFGGEPAEESEDRTIISPAPAAPAWAPVPAEPEPLDVPAAVVGEDEVWAPADVARHPDAPSTQAPAEIEPPPRPPVPAEPLPLEDAALAPPTSAPFDEPFSLGDEPLAVPSPAAALGGAPASAVFDDALLDRLAERILQRMSTTMVERVAWEVVPDVAEALIRKRIVEIEAKLAGE